MLSRRMADIRPNEAAVSFTFDDYPVSAYEAGGRMLQERGWRGTYYVSLGLLGRDAPVGRIASAEHVVATLSDGHELGCHTYSHCHGWETPSATFLESIRANQSAIGRLIPGAEFPTLSYPISCASPGNKRAAGGHFAGARAGGQDINIGPVDLNHLKAFFLEQSRDDFGAVERLILRNKRERGWLIFATHDVTSSPTRFGVTGDFFSRVLECVAASGTRVIPAGAFLAEQGLGSRVRPAARNTGPVPQSHTTYAS